MTIQEKAIRNLSKKQQVQMARLTFDGWRFTLVDEDVMIDNMPRWRAQGATNLFVDSSLEWLVQRAWYEHTRSSRYSQRRA